MEGDQKSRKSKIWTTLTAYGVIFGSGAVVLFAIANLYSDYRKANSDYYSMDKARVTLSSIIEEADPLFAKIPDARKLTYVQQTLKNQLGLNLLAKQFDSFKQYTATRGTKDSFLKIEKEINRLSTELLNLMTEQKFRSAEDMQKVQKYISNAQKSPIQVRVYEYDKALEYTEILETRFMHIKLDPDTKVKVVTQLSNLKAELIKIEARANFFASQYPVVERFFSKSKDTYVAMSSALSVYNSESRFSGSTLFSIAGMAFSAFFIIFVMALRRRNQGSKVVVKEVRVEVPVVSENAEKGLLELLKHNLESPTVLVNENDEVTWVSDSFFSMLQAGFDRRKKYKWSDFTNSEILKLDTSNHIKGTVKIRGREDCEYILKTKSVNSTLGSGMRVICFYPLYNYQVEIHKYMKQIENIKGVNKPQLYEVGDILEDVYEKVHKGLPNTKTNVIFDNSSPLFISIDKKVIAPSLHTMLSGLMIYLENKFGNHTVKINYKRDGDSTKISFLIPKEKIDDVSAPLLFRGKTYPALSAYLAQIETNLANYNAEINIKNLYTQTPKEIKESILEIKLQETKETYSDIDSLKHQSRVNRAVSTAKKVKKEKESSGFH